MALSFVGIIIGAFVTVSLNACQYIIIVGVSFGGFCGLAVAGLVFFLFKKIFKSKLTTTK